MRARNIKPGFFKNEILVTLPFEYRLLFIGLWCYADKEGRFEDRPIKIKIDLFPCDNVDVDKGIQVLNDSGFLTRYNHGNKRFCQITAWHKHQHPHYKENKSLIPALVWPEACPSLALVCPEACPSDSLIPDSLIPDSLIQNTIAKEKSQEPEKPIANDAVCPADSIPLFKFILDDQSEWEPELELLQKLSDTYQNIPDIDEEIKKASAWCFANPSKRKTRRGMPKFLNNWLSKANATNQPIQKKRPLTDYEIRHGWYSGQTGMTFDVIECDDPDCRCHKKEKAK